MSPGEIGPEPCLKSDPPGLTIAETVAYLGAIYDAGTCQEVA